MAEANEIIEKAVLNWEKSLDLSSLELETLPTVVLSKSLCHVTVLNLDYNDLQCLPPDISRLSALRVLSATGNKLRELPESIGKLENLQALHLNENCLQELPMCLSNLWHLEILDAVGNEIDSWNMGLAECLLELRLDENKLTSLPVSLSCMKNLKVLELGENNIVSLPEDIGKLTRLEILNLSSNKLTELPSSVGDLPNLKIFDVSDNCVESLPEVFQSAKVIESFFMEKNYLRTLPTWFDSLSSIVNIGLADNQLLDSPLPESFGVTSGETLRTLDLSANNISLLPDSMGELKHLERLQLGSTISELERRAFQNGNWLRTLPSTFGWIVNLKKLHLDENQLVELPENFGSLVNLEWVDFGQNRLESLPESFCSLSKLWFLQLSQNYLKVLPEDFGNLTNLIELRLSFNYLTELPNSFEKLCSLQTLDLFHNQLTKIPKELLSLKKLIRLDLDKNKFRLKAEKVPKLTKQVKYPSKDPSLVDNWRGKLREDYIEPDEEKTVEILKEVNENVDSDDDDDDDDKEACASEAALELAMKRSLSIWKSHNGPDEREMKPKGKNAETIPTYQTVSSEKREEIILELSKDIYNEMFEDADEVSLNETRAQNEEMKQSAFDLQNSASLDEKPSNPLDTAEDWDKEIQDSIAYNMVLEAFQERRNNKVYFQNKLQNLLYSYPPASQAFTKTANYESAVSYCSSSPPCNVPGVSDVVEGQFDDAEEDPSM